MDMFHSWFHRIVVFGCAPAWLLAVTCQTRGDGPAISIERTEPATNVAQDAVEHFVSHVSNLPPFVCEYETSIIYKLGDEREARLSAWSTLHLSDHKNKRERIQRMRVHLPGNPDPQKDELFDKNLPPEVKAKLDEIVKNQRDANPLRAMLGRLGTIYLADENKRLLRDLPDGRIYDKLTARSRFGIDKYTNLLLLPLRNAGSMIATSGYATEIPPVFKFEKNSGRVERVVISDDDDTRVDFIVGKPPGRYLHSLYFSAQIEGLPVLGECRFLDATREEDADTTADASELPGSPFATTKVRWERAKESDPYFVRSVSLNYRYRRGPKKLHSTIIADVHLSRVVFLDTVEDRAFDENSLMEVLDFDTVLKRARN